MNYIDKKVSEILRELKCQTIDEAMEKLSQINHKLRSGSQMHLDAFEKNSL